MTVTTRGKKRLRCGFCGLPEDEVEDLVAGPTVLICGTCIDLSHDIVEAARKRRACTVRGVDRVPDAV